MAFLTKKEQTVIKAIKTTNKLKADDQVKMVHAITFNATVRQAGHRMPVREFLHAMAEHNTNRILKNIQ